jgi:hypothetical protein
MFSSLPVWQSWSKSTIEKIPRDPIIFWEVSVVEV